jgi:6-phosphogluconate dehydrogenase
MSNEMNPTTLKSRIGVFGMGVMGQNLALNIASKKFPVSCYNREDEFSSRLFEALEIAKKEAFGEKGEDEEHLLRAFTDLKAFVESLQKPR